jgi:uncharacterized protein YggE
MRTTATALFLALSACAGPAAAQAPSKITPTVPATPAVAGFQRTVRVSGEGRVQVKPDIARVTAGVQVTGKDVKTTTAEAEARMRAVLADLAKAGIAEKDVQTSQFQLAAERPWVNGRQGAIQGYTATNMVRITVRKLDQLSTILSRITAVGGNSVDGVAFEREDPAPAQREALAKAVVAAREKAEALAKAAGVALGDVLAIDEGGGGRPMPMPMMAMAMRGKAADEGAPVEAGELEVAATVEVVFGIR